MLIPEAVFSLFYSANFIKQFHMEENEPKRELPICDEIFY